MTRSLGALRRDRAMEPAPRTPGLDRAVELDALADELVAERDEMRPKAVAA